MAQAHLKMILELTIEEAKTLADFIDKQTLHEPPTSEDYIISDISHAIHHSEPTLSFEDRD